MITKFDVVIVTWNCAAVIDECLTSVFAQNRLFLGDVVVLDNASSDNTVASIEAAWPRVKLIKSEVNLGFAAGCNRAVAAGTSEWVLLLNPDARLESGALEALSSRSVTMPAVDLLGCDLVLADRPDLWDGVGDCYHISGLAWRAGHRQPVAHYRRFLAHAVSPCAAAAAYRRAVFLGLGGFDEDFFCYFEDVDFGLRALACGFAYAQVPAARAVHLGSAITATVSGFALYHGHRNLVWTYFKNMPGPFFWLFLPLHCMMTLTVLIRAAFAGGLMGLLRAKSDAIRGLPGMLSKRRVIQHQRVLGAVAMAKAMSWRFGGLRPFLAAPKR